jgi:Mrp family chromosome partitioning ATPase
VAIVVNEGKTRKQVVKAAIQPLIEGKANVIGVILNRRVFAIPRFIYNRI